MRKIFFIMIFVLLTSPNLVFSADSWDDLMDVNKAWDGQKTITNQEYEEALDYMESKQNQQKEKIKKKKIKKISGGGTSLHSNLNPLEEIKEQVPVKKNEDGSLLNIPVKLIIGEEVLDAGFYKVIAKKDENKEIYLYFYQSQFFKGKIRAFETDDDFEEKTIDFVNLLPYNQRFVKVVFGSLDFNAYAYVRFLEN